MSLPRMSERVMQTTTHLIFPKPLTFGEWLENGFQNEGLYELIDGTLVEKTMVQLDHEKCEAWLFSLLNIYVQERNLGLMLHSRSPVRITEFRGRMPDLFFVQRERLHIVGQKATTEAPDLVIEIISPGDGPADVRALETDYRFIGVPEIVFLEQGKRRVRVVRREEDVYSSKTLTTEDLVLHALGDLTLPLDWLFAESRPALRPTLAYLLGETPHPPIP